jgi:hypothetical protein
MSSVWTFNPEPLGGEGPPIFTTSLGNGRLSGCVSRPTEPGGRIFWTVADLRTGAADAFIDSGEADTVDAAKNAAEDSSLAFLRRPGRKPLGGRPPMTSTDRNKQRMARLLAREAQADEDVRLLAELHRDLVAAGEREWAARVAAILHTGALKALAEYTRRNANRFRSQDADGERRIVALADKIDALAEMAGDKSAKYEQFEEIRQDLRKEGSYPTNDLMSAVAQGYFLGG